MKNALSHIVSDIFCPLLVPTYAMAIAMWTTSLKALPERSRLVVTIIVAAITALLPAVALIILRSTGRVSDFSISRRDQRTVPIIITTACYILAAVFLGMARAPLWLPLFFYGAALAATLALFITFRWKISAHTTAMGGLVGMILWLAVKGLADVNAMAMLSAAIIASGAVATARITLGRHTLPQTTTGFALGLASTFMLEIICLY